MGLVIKKSECKRRIDYLSQLEVELENIVFQKEIKSRRILSHKEIEKKVVKKNKMTELLRLDHARGSAHAFEEIANLDKTFIARISKN